MKKIFLILAAMSSLIVFAGVLSAKENNQSQEINIKAEVKEAVETQEAVNANSDEKKEIQQEVKLKIDEAALDQARKKREADLKKAKEQLSKQPEWVIYMTSLTDKKSMGPEVLSFIEGKVSAKEFSSKGYLQSNCTITPQEDGTIVWETMQANEKGDIIFWRGELKDNFMQGMISMQPKDGKNQDIAFTTAAPKVGEEKIVQGKGKQEKEAPKNKRDKGKK